ncbi:MAG: SpoIIE family protein phosphatase [Acidobacteriaceae bacterium]|nr:SpoIIE family protein phosphatase [Acidobacteriaceae bacterium]
MTRILIAEDEPGIAFGLESDLQAEGYEVVLAGDGQQAIRRAQAENFDLILLDVMLPHKDGFEVCRELRHAGLTTPIVMLTAKTSEFDKVMGLDLGADDYVTKPFSPRELRARIRAAMRHKSSEPPGTDLHRQLKVAADVQRRLFPQHRPVVATLDYAGLCQPALGMSGDYYDFLDLAPGKLGILIADVAGKGIPAALLMASLHASIRTRAPFFEDRCGELLADLNALLYESTDSATYATMFYAVYADSSRVLTYANAGNEAPLLLRGESSNQRECLRLDSRTPPVGLLPKLPASQASVQLQAGDWLLIFTDGVTEARNQDGAEFGCERILAALNNYSGDTAEQARDHVLDALKHHSGGVPPADDVTLIAAHVLDAAPEP